ncbi:Disease resistance protein LAZ5 [Cardamine amara subsp. amara]|uniref:Disease resistance protein LAZ5 n=1 Tax=Cardamine amara subsp. amara TaxID=228776 RepID=A0ABD1ASE0_CARAN
MTQWKQKKVYIKGLINDKPSLHQFLYNRLSSRIHWIQHFQVILSTRYAESKWCLEELTKIMEQAEYGEMIVIPIFYKVKPEDVRRQKGVFGERFRRRTEESSRKEMEKWQLALKAVSNKIGFTLDHNRYI